MILARDYADRDDIRVRTARKTHRCTGVRLGKDGERISVWDNGPASPDHREEIESGEKYVEVTIKELGRWYRDRYCEPCVLAARMVRKRPPKGGHSGR